MSSKKARRRKAFLEREEKREYAITHMHELAEELELALDKGDFQSGVKILVEQDKLRGKIK